MKKITTLFILLLFGISGAVDARQRLAPVILKGYVFVDGNRNGLRDKNEKGVKGVLISDQVEVVSTNETGYYELASECRFGLIHISQPDGFTVNGSFWKSVSRGQQETSIDFPLLPSPGGPNVTFVHASDPHLSDRSLPQLEKLRAIVDSVRPAFFLMTGDLIRDALRVSEKEATAFYDLYVKTIGTFPVPVWNVPGNHEIFGIERHKSLVSESHPLYGKKMYRHYLGPDYYSFNYGGIHFIGLNSVDYHDLWYYGHIDSVQLEWLKKDVSFIPNTTPVITFNHIPFYSGGLSMGEYTDEEPGSSLISIDGKKQYRHVVSNAPAVMEVLKGKNYPVALSGHYHSAQQFSFESDDQKTQFHQTGAVVGPAYEGGIQMTSGVTFYRISGGKVVDRTFIRLK